MYSSILPIASITCSRYTRSLCFAIYRLHLCQNVFAKIRTQEISGHQIHLLAEHLSQLPLHSHHPHQPLDPFFPKPHQHVHIAVRTIFPPGYGAKYSQKLHPVTEADFFQLSSINFQTNHTLIVTQNCTIPFNPDQSTSLISPLSLCPPLSTLAFPFSPAPHPLPQTYP